MSISVVINTFNSEKTLHQCLEAVKEFEEIVICDMYSTDSTLSIAKEYNCKIVMHEFCGIVEPARSFAINAATNEWVFVIDSDEVVPETLKKFLYKISHDPKSEDGFFIPRKNFFMGKFMHSTFPDYQLRFFKKEQFRDWPSTIHATPKIDGKIVKIPAEEPLAFIHLDKNRIIDMISKMNKYTERDLERRQHKRENLSGLIFKPFFRFFKMYILKGGFKDGKAGFIYACMRAYSKFALVAKMIERQNQK